MKSSAKLAAIIGLCLAFNSGALGDTILLRNGGTLSGVILKETSKQVILRLKFTTVTLERTEIESIKKTEPEEIAKYGSNQLAGWEKCLEVVVRQQWVSDLKAIPATVIDKGILRNVPYKSFRAGDYEINIYGDPDNPSCVEIGIYGKLINDEIAKQNCFSFIKGIVASEEDRRFIKTLKPSKDMKKRALLTFEVTPETDEDAYGGWWISAYNESALNDARASDEELKKITIAKKDIQAKGKKRKAAGASDQEEKLKNDENEYSSSDLRYARPSNQDPTGSGGTVYVRGYTRKDGTYVQPHTRSAPRR